MGDITNARLVYGLFASGTHTGVNQTGSILVGRSQTSVNNAAADIAYSFSITSDDAGDVATLTLSSGVVSQTTGVPVIVNGDGNDFEGDPIATLVTAYAMLVEPVGTTTGTMDVSTSVSANGFGKSFAAGSTIPFLCQIPSTGTISFDFSAAADSYKVTILGKSS
jgi:hypothetical protein